MIRRKGSDANLLIGPEEEPCDLFDFLQLFVGTRSTPTVHYAEQRSWFLKPALSTSMRTHDGHISYGTHGFESEISDGRTGVKKYQRQTSDLEAIDLYYQFWLPEGQKFGILAFQSFGARSCVQLIKSALAEQFKNNFPNHVLYTMALSPSKAMMDAAPVKSVTFYGSADHSDRADKFAKPGVGVSYELTLRAKKRGSYFSTYKDVRDEFGTNPSGVVEFEGREFGGVSADIKFGGRTRTVGVYGAGHEPGLIDVTADIERAKSGQPTLQSIRKQADELMETYYDSLKV